MKTLGTNDVYLTIADLVKLNPAIKEAVGYIDVAKSRYTKSVQQNDPKAKNKSWAHYSDTLTGDSFLKYSNISQNFKVKYNLPAESLLIDQIKADAEQERIEQKQIKAGLFENQIGTKLDNAVIIDFAKYCPKYSLLHPGNKEKVFTLAKTHAVFQCCIELSKTHTLRAIHKAYEATKGIKVTLTSYSRFCKTLNEYEKNGINLKHKSAGSPPKHLVKVTDFHKGAMEKYRMHPNQYTYVQITELVNKQCKDAGLKPVSVETVSQYLRQPEVKNRLSFYFNKSYFRKNVQPSSRRRNADFAGDEYYADGSPLQMFCWNKTRTAQIRLNLFVVMDVHSKKIVGFDMAESEDRYNWFAAFKMAFSMEKILPYNIIYDNASATKTDEFKTLKEELLAKGCHLNAAKKGNPQAKAQVERWFETFQSGFQRMIDGFIGEGIKSRRDNGRIDAEYLQKVQKHKGFYSYDDMQTIVTELIGIYNEKPVKKRKAANKLFRESDKPNACKIGMQDIAMLFWMHKTIKVNRAEIKFEIRHNPYYYEIFNHELALKLNGQQVKVYYDEQDLSSVQIFTLNNEYLGQLRQKRHTVLAKANQTENDVLEIIKQSKHNESLATTIKKLTNETAAKADAINPDVFARVLDPFTVAKDDYNSAETEMMRSYVREQKGIDYSAVAEYEPVIAQGVGQNKETLQERHSKKFMVTGSLKPVGRI